MKALRKIGILAAAAETAEEKTQNFLRKENA